MNSPRSAALEVVLKQDGITLSGSGAERDTKCWDPSHEDGRPSMRVNVQKGVYNCHGCGIGGNVINYLRDYRNMSGKEIAAFLKDQGWADDQVHTKTLAAEEVERKRKNTPKLLEAVSQEIYYNKQSCQLTNEYHYFNLDGALVGVVGRYYYEKDGKPDKTFRQYTPASTGGFWASGPITSRIPASDRAKQWPLYNILQALERIEGAEDARIWVVEGEKCCDALANIKDRPEGAPAAVSLSGGSKTGGAKGTFEKHDLSPLYGREVLIVADADEPGRMFAGQLGAQLLKLDSETSVVVILPEGDNGYDIGDAVASGGYPNVVDWFKECEVKALDAPGTPSKEEGV